MIIDSLRLAYLALTPEKPPFRQEFVCRKRTSLENNLVKQFHVRFQILVDRKLNGCQQVLDTLPSVLKSVVDKSVSTNLICPFLTVHI